MSSRPRPPCRSAADLPHLCRCRPPPPGGAFGLTVASANANGGDSVASLPALFRPRQKRKRRRSRLHPEALGSSRGGVLTQRQFPPHITTINQIIFVCFRPPRDLDSKACVTIGEKVPSPAPPPPFSPIQGLNLFSLRSYVTAHCLLLRPSAFGLVQSHARSLALSLFLSLPPPHTLWVN